MPAVPEGEEYVYTSCEIEMLGPHAPSREDILTQGYVKHFMPFNKASGFLAL